MGIENDICSLYRFYKNKGGEPSHAHARDSKMTRTHLVTTVKQGWEKPTLLHVEMFNVSEFPCSVRISNVFSGYIPRI